MFKQTSPFGLGYPELLHRASQLEVPEYPILNNIRGNESSSLALKSEADENLDSDEDSVHIDESNEDATQKSEPESLSPIDSALPKLQQSYVNNLDQLFKNQFLQQINFKTMINNSSGSHTRNNDDKINNFNTTLMNCDNENKINSKSTNFTIENLIRK